MDSSSCPPGEGASAIAQDEQLCLSAIFGMIERESGIRLQDYRQSGIARRTANRLKLSGCHDYRQYLVHLESHPDEMGRLLEYVTIKWSRFFRDERVYEQLKTQILPALLASKGNRLSVWSAGCANGEEPYSLAILLQQLAPGAGRALILGTDIAPSALAAAQVALYSPWSLDGVPEALIEDYFTPEATRFQTRYRLRDTVRGSARFLRHDLLSATGPPEGRSFDLVLCRNVLIYFDRQVHGRVFDLLAASLNTGGFLCLGEAEQLPTTHGSLFDTVDKKDRIYRRR